MEFFKYQSLGNDFIVLDFYKDNQQPLPDIKKLCDRNFGIGADGVLILTNNGLPQGIIYNSDGSLGQLCLNGLRCLAQHLYTHHSFPNNFFIEMGSKQIECRIQHQSITTIVSKATYQCEKIVNGYNGHVVHAPNPHFIVFQETTPTWLKANGGSLEKHPDFSNGTNVEFIWPSEEPNTYNMLVYERGCGYTLSCSSGALSVMTTLNKFDNLDYCVIRMSGGDLSCTMKNEQVILTANAKLIYKGKIDWNNF